MAEPKSALAVLATLFTLIFFVNRAEATWCVTRSDASDQALQAALDYACGFGADCAPIQSNGLCYLPNTLLAHASYAYNSYYQRKGRAPGSCDFAGTANIAKTDPSYGSCVYPSTASTAGGPVTPGGSMTPLTTQPTLYPPPARATNQRSGGGVRSPSIDVGPVVPNTDNSRAPPKFSTVTTLIPVSYVLTILHMFRQL